MRRNTVTTGQNREAAEPDLDLVLFDVDGTLVDSMRIDGLCFVRAVRDVLGISEIETDWSTYPDTTDAAILGHLIERAGGARPTSAQIASVKNRFIHLLHRSVSGDPSLCRAIPGGPDLLKRLTASPYNVAAIATGGWEESARFKLSTAGYDISAVPIASANDSHARTEILALATERAASLAGGRRFDRITYVGDGVWDLRAASALGYRFIGRGDPRASDLVAEGVRELVADFSDVEYVLRLLKDS